MQTELLSLRYEEHHSNLQAGTAKMLREEVTEADIADIISKWSGIPVT